MGRDRKGASAAPGAQGKELPGVGGMLAVRPEGTQEPDIRQMLSWRRTVAYSRLHAFTNGLLHVHALVVSGLIKGHAGLLLVGQQDAAAGVDHAAVALGQVLGNILRLAALCAVAGDEEEAVLVLGARISVASSVWVPPMTRPMQE